MSGRSKEATLPLQLTNLAQQQAIEKILRLGVTSALVGAGARGMSGMLDVARAGSLPEYDMPSRHAPKKPLIRLRPRPEVEQEQDSENTLKAAEDKGPFSDAAGWLANRLGLIQQPGAQQPGLLKRTLTAPNTVRAVDKPYFIPGAAATMAAGGLGGYKLVDWIMDKRKDQELEDELAKAKEEYSMALQGKAAADLGDVYDSMEKQGVLGGLLGAYLATLGATAVAGGLGGYHWAKGDDKTVVDQRALAEAMRRYRQAQRQTAPLNFVAIPDRPEEPEKPQPVV